MARHSGIDYAFKSKVLQEHNDLVIRQREASYFDYCKDMFENNGIVLYGAKNKQKYNIGTDDLYFECCMNGLNKEYLEAEKINNAYFKRLKRLKIRVSEIIKKPSLFITLTFNDYTLENTTPKQRRVYVSRYLKKFNCLYVANIDFGKLNHREHYHALIQTNYIDLDGWHNNGAIDVEHVRLKDIEKDTTKITKYINKLVNHAIKETTKRSALLYSR